MAKKETKIEVISEETKIVPTNNLTKEKNDKKNIIDDLTLTDLVYVEKAINVVCKKYENTLRNYDGSISRHSKEYEKFQIFNELRSNVIEKMENELLKLI